MNITKELSRGVSGRLSLCLLFATVTQLVSPLAMSGDLLDKQISLDIPQNTKLADALIEWGATAGVTVMINTSTVNRETIQSVHGKLSARTALTQLLRDSGLWYLEEGGRILVVPSTNLVRSAQREDHLQSPSQSQKTTLTPETGDGSNSGGSDDGSALDRKDAETVIVTARKRAENILDVPISIVAVGGNELQQRQITTLEDLPYAVPDLSFVKNGNTYSFEIRGVSNFSGNSPLIGLYVDDADATLQGVGVQILPVTYDIDRVEVLRGPQGTLYGEGSAGGTIHFVTKNPNLQSLQFDSQVTALFTEGGDPSQRINAMMNVPLISDQLALRLTTTFEHDGGWIEEPAAGLTHINGQNLTDVRLKGLWQPDSRFSVSAMAIIDRTDRGQDFIDPNSNQNFTQVFNLTTVPTLKKGYDLYNLTMTYDVAPTVRLLNTTTYLKVDGRAFNSPGSFPFSQDGTQIFESYSPFEENLGHLLTDELRLTSTGSGPWQWTVGGQFRHYHYEFNIPVTYYGFLGAPGTPLPPPVPYDIATIYKSWSAFGDTSYRIGDRVTIGAGVRYFGETQDFSDFAALTHQTGNFHSTDPRAYAQLKLTDNANVYASASKGFRSGGFNVYGQPTYGPEGVWTYELGSKWQLLDGRLGFDAATYLTNYSNYQVYGYIGANLQPYYSNSGLVRIKGIEANLNWSPLAHWRFDARGNYLNGRLVEVTAKATQEGQGDPLNAVPRYQFTLSGQHDFVLLTKQDTIRVDYNQVASQSYINNSIAPWFRSTSGIVQSLDLHASSMLNSNLRLGFSVQNLLNDHTFLNPAWYVGNGVRPRPRTFGVDFSATFD